MSSARFVRPSDSPSVTRRTALRLGACGVAGLFVANARSETAEGAAAAKKVTLIAGGGDGPPGGPATQLKLNAPFGSVMDRNGRLIIVEHDGQRVLAVNAKGLTMLIAGDGERGDRGDGGPAAHARFNDIHSVGLAENGDLYIADTRNSRVRVIDGAKETIRTIAGTGESGYSGDGGPATKAKFGHIYCATLDPAGKRLYLADLDNRRIRVVDLDSGIVTLVAGNGERGAPRDGAVATNSPLFDPRAVMADEHGNVYVLERSGNALRVVDPKGRIRTVAGTGEAGYSGDGGPALSAMMNGPKHLCADLEGNILICDTENHAVRKYSPKSGEIHALVGTGKEGAAGLSGPPEQAELNRPHGVYVHSDGKLYIADSGNHRVLVVA